ncbi:MAG: hypothetical protein HQL52_15160 [Magnetococcales bacterium]|nr:hypothetical protein [Magnetococcales bacterium]
MMTMVRDELSVARPCLDEAWQGLNREAGHQKEDLQGHLESVHSELLLIA